MKKNELQTIIDKHEKTINKLQKRIDKLVEACNIFNHEINEKDELMVGARAIICYLDHKVSCNEDE